MASHCLWHNAAVRFAPRASARIRIPWYRECHGKWEKVDLRNSPFGRLLESARWKPILEFVGLNEVMADRLLRLLLIHLTLDGVITAALTLRLLRSVSASANFDDLSRHVAKMSIARRADLCMALGITSDAWKSDFEAFNAVRNKLSHFNPKIGLDKVKELCTESAFEACIQKGLRAMKLAEKESS